MAQKLHISDYSVKSHIHNILEKLALRTRIEQTNKIAGVGTLKAFSESISMFDK
jgi:DNA-binding NarL/FixJ family response regulator